MPSFLSLDSNTFYKYEREMKGHFKYFSHTQTFRRLYPHVVTYLVQQQQRSEQGQATGATSSSSSSFFPKTQSVSYSICATQRDSACVFSQPVSLLVLYMRQRHRRDTFNYHHTHTHTHSYYTTALIKNCRTYLTFLHCS